MACLSSEGISYGTWFISPSSVCWYLSTLPLVWGWKGEARIYFIPTSPSENLPVQCESSLSGWTYAWWRSLPAWWSALFPQCEMLLPKWHLVIPQTLLAPFLDITLLCWGKLVQTPKVSVNLTPKSVPFSLTIYSSSSPILDKIMVHCIAYRVTLLLKLGAPQSNINTIKIVIRKSNSIL